jgi:hypothetical protein
MGKLRAAMSARLLSFAADIAYDREQMWRGASRCGARLTSADWQLLGALELVSTVALRIGLFLMPAQPAEPFDAPAGHTEG